MYHSFEGESYQDRIDADRFSGARHVHRPFTRRQENRTVRDLTPIPRTDAPIITPYESTHRTEDGYWEYRGPSKGEYEQIRGSGNLNPPFIAGPERVERVARDDYEQQRQRHDEREQRERREYEDRFSSNSHVTKCNISERTDMTVHLQLEATDDISADLEQTSRLHRLGNFAAAKRYFVERLNDHHQNLYVLVQYAHMLHDSGDYKRHLSLSTSTTSYHGAVKSDWDLVRSASIMRTVDALPIDQSKLNSLLAWKKYSESGQKCSSTEIQHFVMALHQVSYASRLQGGIKSDLVQRAHRDMPYHELVSEGQIWDFRDMFISLVYADPGMEILPSLYKEDDCIGLFNAVSRHWDMASYDESTSLALLDIAEAILLISQKSKDIFRRLMDAATKLVSSLLQNNAEVMISRQYLRWVVIKVASEDYKELGHPGLHSPVGSPGIFLTQQHFLCPPLYVPCQSETPTLSTRQSRADLVAHIETALDLAKQIDDYESEVLCLQALILQSDEPLAIFDRLLQFQRDVQGDIQGCLQTSLSKYTFCQSQESRSGLRNDLLTLRISENFPSPLLWARAMILRALSPSAAEAASYLEVASRHANADGTPGKYRAFMNLISQLRSLNSHGSSHDRLGHQRPTGVRTRVMEPSDLKNDTNQPRNLYPHQVPRVTTASSDAEFLRNLDPRDNTQSRVRDLYQVYPRAPEHSKVNQPRSEWRPHIDRRHDQSEPQYQFVENESRDVIIRPRDWLDRENDSKQQDAQDESRSAHAGKDPEERMDKRPATVDSVSGEDVVEIVEELR